MMKTANQTQPAPAAGADQLVYLQPDVLKTHPQNMRRQYPDADVKAMANSIRACGGVIQPLRIVHNGHAGHYFVVDGNMRLAGARLLGRECPPLKCELVDESESRQLLDMITTAKLRFDPDPISEAVHYQRLLGGGKTVSQIADETGVTATTIHGRLRLLELAPEIQDLIAAGRLPRDARVADALLAVPDARVRGKLAVRFARDGVGIKAAVGACAKAVEMLRAQAVEAEAADSDGPAVAHARTRALKHSEPTLVLSDWSEVRGAVQAVCAQCEIKTLQLQSVAEPAWEMITHAATDTCAVCNVRSVRSACAACPVVDVLQRLVKIADSPAGGK